MIQGSRWGMPVLVGTLVVLHFVLRVGLGLGALAPDLLVVATLLASRQMRPGSAAGLGLFLGILEGSLVPFGLGSAAVALTLLGYLGSRSRDIFSSEGLLSLAIFLFAGKWLFDIILSTVSGEILRPLASELLVVSPLAALYAAAAGLLAFATYRALA